MKLPKLKPLHIAVIVVGFLFLRGRNGGVPPDPGVTPPTIPPQSSSYQLSRVTFKCKDVGTTDLQDWEISLGVSVTPPRDFLMHIVVIDTVTKQEVGRFTDTRSVGNTSNHEYVTHNVRHPVTGLTPCRLYNTYCYVTNSTETESYYRLETGAEKTRCLS